MVDSENIRLNCGNDDNAERPSADEMIRLPESFYYQLLQQPACLTTGECNNCGRCQH